jgi:hypothetical protein
LNQLLASGIKVIETRSTQPLPGSTPTPKAAVAPDPKAGATPDSKDQAKAGPKPK